MKRFTSTVLLAIAAFNIALAQTKENNDYVEFDDRKNIVHGVYFGFNVHYGKIDNQDTALGNVKLAYVANQQIEIGFAITGFFNERPNDNPTLFNGDKIAMLGGYAGLHVEPILFGKKFISVSFPLLVGGGLVGYSGNENNEYENLKKDDFDDFFIVEPGVNILYNFSRFTQLETGIKYRLTSKYNLLPYEEGNLNGFSIGAGLKIGIFNMGRKKRKIKDDFN